jgi:hypothetical protein
VRSPRHEGKADPSYREAGAVFELGMVDAGALIGAPQCEGEARKGTYAEASFATPVATEDLIEPFARAAFVKSSPPMSVPFTKT